MARRLTDAELIARCRCGVSIDEPSAHHSHCPIRSRVDQARQRATNPDQPRNKKEAAKQQTAAEVATQFAAPRAYLAGGGRPNE